MEHEQTTNNESKFSEEPSNTSCCSGWGMSDFFRQCCDGASGPRDCRSMMADCMKKCRWFMLIPVLIGIALLLVGYVLDAEATRLLWMTGAGLVILMGALGLLLMSLGRKTRS